MRGAARSVGLKRFLASNLAIKDGQACAWYVHVYIYIYIYIYIYMYMYTYTHMSISRENGKGGMRKGGIGNFNKNIKTRIHRSFKVD